MLIFPELELIDISKDRVKGAALGAQVEMRLLKPLKRKSRF